MLSYRQFTQKHRVKYEREGIDDATKRERYQNYRSTYEAQNRSVSNRRLSIQPVRQRNFNNLLRNGDLATAEYRRQSTASLVQYIKSLVDPWHHKAHMPDMLQYASIPVQIKFSKTLFSDSSGNCIAMMRPGITRCYAVTADSVGANTTTNLGFQGIMGDSTVTVTPTYNLNKVSPPVNDQLNTFVPAGAGSEYAQWDQTPWQAIPTWDSVRSTGVAYRPISGGMKVSYVGKPLEASGSVVYGPYHSDYGLPDQFGEDFPRSLTFESCTSLDSVEVGRARDTFEVRFVPYGTQMGYRPIKKRQVFSTPASYIISSVQDLKISEEAKVASEIYLAFERSAKRSHIPANVRDELGAILSAETVDNSSFNTDMKPALRAVVRRWKELTTPQEIAAHSLFYEKWERLPEFVQDGKLTPLFKASVGPVNEYGVSVSADVQTCDVDPQEYDALYAPAITVIVDGKASDTTNLAPFGFNTATPASFAEIIPAISAGTDGDSDRFDGYRKRVGFYQDWNFAGDLTPIFFFASGLDTGDAGTGAAVFEVDFVMNIELIPDSRAFSAVSIEATNAVHDPMAEHIARTVAPKIKSASTPVGQKRGGSILQDIAAAIPGMLSVGRKIGRVVPKILNGIDSPVAADISSALDAAGPTLSTVADALPEIAMALAAI